MANRKMEDFCPVFNKANPKVDMTTGNQTVDSITVGGGTTVTKIVVYTATRRHLLRHPSRRRHRQQ